MKNEEIETLEVKARRDAEQVRHTSFSAALDDFQKVMQSIDGCGASVVSILRELIENPSDSLARDRGALIVNMFDGWVAERDRALARMRGYTIEPEILILPPVSLGLWRNQEIGQWVIASDAEQACAVSRTGRDKIPNDSPAYWERVPNDQEVGAMPRCPEPVCKTAAEWVRENPEPKLLWIDFADRALKRKF